MLGFGRLTQEQIVFGLAVLLCIGFALALPGFLTANNVLNLVRSVSILGILGVAMGLVIIGRGIDLSLVALMAISVAWSLNMIAAGMPIAQALAIGLAFSLFIGAVNGWLVAYVEIPAIFATLAMGTLIYGFGRYYLFDLDVAYMPESGKALLWLGQGTLFGIPVPIFLFAGVCFGGYLFLRYARAGRYLRAVGDNVLAARITGVPARPIIVMQYVLSSLIGFMAGIITAASVASMNTRLAISTYVYDVVLVVVLGGIGLSGGKGGIRNVIVGTLLIGVLLNGMTIMDIQYTVQNVIKGIILLTAIVIDTIVNPRDEQTAQQGDI
ncbi:MAG TPA: ABC transporter permease [Rhizobiaceae bacterium]|nr:ABC transporter permease [Rhizobiaceae bacterium]